MKRVSWRQGWDVAWCNFEASWDRRCAHGRQATKFGNGVNNHHNNGRNDRAPATQLTEASPKQVKLMGAQRDLCTRSHRATRYQRAREQRPSGERRGMMFASAWTPMLNMTA